MANEKVRAAMFRIGCPCGGHATGFSGEYPFALTEDLCIVFLVKCGRCGRDYQAVERLSNLIMECPANPDAKAN